MLTYEVTCRVESGYLEAYERFMREHHIPDLLATGCFTGAELLRAAPGRYQIRYWARSQADLDRYFAEYASRFRAEFLSRFPDGVSLARETWAAVQRWETGPAAPG